jgi:hypothetical protein
MVITGRNISITLRRKGWMKRQMEGRSQSLSLKDLLFIAKK